MKFITQLFFILFISCAGYSSAQEISLLTFDDLQKKSLKENDTVYVLNFWATWCKPCVEELPYFEKFNLEYQAKPVKIILVNVDFNKQVKTATEPFVKKKMLRSEIVHITDTDPNEWIAKVDSIWSGAIPATVMYKTGLKTYFKEGAMKEEELKGAIERSLLRETH